MPSIRQPLRVAAALAFVAALSLVLAWPSLRSAQVRDKPSKLVEHTFEGEVLLSLGTWSDNGYECGGIFAFDLRERSFEQVTHECDWSGAQWSPDYGSLVVSAHRKLFVVDPSTGFQRQLTDPQKQRDDDVFGWSPDGRTVMFERRRPSGGSPHPHFGVDVATGREHRMRIPWLVYHPIWSPDGRLVAFGSLPSKGGTLLVVPPGVIYRKRLVWDAVERTPPVRPRTKAGRPVREFVTLFYDTEWSPDGRWISFAADTIHDGGGVDVGYFLRDAATGLTTRLGWETSGAWTREGELLLMGDGSLYVLDPVTLRRRVVLDDVELPGGFTDLGLIDA